MNGPAAQIVDELSRRIASMVRIGLIAEVEHDYVDADGNHRPRLRVQSGDILTGWLPWPAQMGRNYVAWRPLAVGQEVVLLSPSGDLTQAVVVSLLHVNSDPPPSMDETLDIIRFRSGTTVQHDADTGDVVVTGVRDVIVDAGRNIEAEAAAQAEVTAPQVVVNGSTSVTINGPTTINGNLQVNGTIGATGDVSAGAISGKTHTHGGVQTGGGTTGAPQ